MLGACSPCGTDIEHDCTAVHGLTYLPCDDESYRFSNGMDTDDADEAFLLCHCPLQNVACADGRTATMCLDFAYNRIQSSLGDTVRFNDGEQMRFNAGYAACYGYDSCSMGTSCHGPSPAYWYMECVRGSDEFFIAWDGKVFENNQDGVRRYCTGESFEEASKMCRFSIGSCAELSEAECDEARPCSWDGIAEPEVCADRGLDLDCAGHDDQADCNSDPACNWE